MKTGAKQREVLTNFNSGQGSKLGGWILADGVWLVMRGWMDGVANRGIEIEISKDGISRGGGKRSPSLVWGILPGKSMGYHF